MHISPSVTPLAYTVLPQSPSAGVIFTEEASEYLIRAATPDVSAILPIVLRCSMISPADACDACFQ
jgi:hypothetical protein